MALIDVLESKDIEQIRQSLFAAITHLSEVVQALLDTTKVKITIEFEKKETPNA